MTSEAVRAALAALAAELPQPQTEHEVTLAEAKTLLGVRDDGTAQRTLEAAGWLSRKAVLASGRKAQVWRQPA